MIKRARVDQERLVSECRASGKSAKAWCESKGISYSTYMGWAKPEKHEAQAKPETTAREQDQPEPSVTWAELDVTSDEPKEPDRRHSEYCISLSRGGWSISIEDGFDVELLAGVMRVVDRVCC